MMFQGESKKPRPLQMHQVRSAISSSLAKSLVSNSSCLTCLELQNIPLDFNEVASLAKTLKQNKNITHLSLQQCKIGDDGCRVIGRAITNLFNISSINLSYCGLSWKGVEHLVIVTKHQIICRQNDVWRESLRSSEANLDVMGGLQRITLNGNPKIGNKGAELLSEIIKDDIWLKAIDIQSCNVKDKGARHLLQSLKENSTIYIVDVRRNPISNRNLLVRIGQQLYFNNQGNVSQFKWLAINAKHGFAKKCVGIPWRTSARLSSLRHFPSYVPGIANVFLSSNPNLFVNVFEETDRRDFKELNSRKSLEQQILLKDITAQLRDLKLLVENERGRCKEAENKIIELTTENEKLKQELAKTSAHVLDTNTLTTIEHTFQKFNDFLAMLKESNSSSEI